MIDKIQWGICMGCGDELPATSAGYCKPCIEQLRGESLPDTIGCAECVGEGNIDGTPCTECGGTGQVEWD